jgi:hypothetical protein
LFKLLNVGGGLNEWKREEKNFELNRLNFEALDNNLARSGFPVSAFFQISTRRNIIINFLFIGGNNKIFCNLGINLNTSFQSGD